MKKNDTDTSYMDITDLINRGHKFTTYIPPEVGYSLMEKLKITEETETVITGNYDDWSRLVYLIIDIYNELDDLDSSKLKIELSELDTSPRNENGVVSDFLMTQWENFSEDEGYPPEISFKGTIRQQNRLFEILRDFERVKILQSLTFNPEDPDGFEIPHEG